MGKNILTESLNSYLKTFIDKTNGHASQEDLNLAADILYKTIDNLIATRIWQNNEILSKERSKKRLEAAEKLNDQVQLTCSEIKSLMALSSAPNPANPEEYAAWYENDRQQALKLG